MSIYQNKTGKFTTSYDDYEIHLYGLPFKIEEVRVNNETQNIADISIDEDVIRIPKDFNELTISGK